MGRMRRMLLRGTAVALSAAVLAAGALASCSMGGDPGRGIQGAGDGDQDAGPGENPGGGPGDDTDDGTVVDMTEAAPGVDMTDCPYLKIEKRYGTTYVGSGIYEERLPDDGSIVIPDGVGWAIRGAIYTMNRISPSAAVWEHQM